MPSKARKQPHQDAARAFLDAIPQPYPPIRSMARTLRDVEPGLFGTGDKGLTSARNALNIVLDRNTTRRSSATHYKAPGWQGDRPIPPAVVRDTSPYVLPAGRYLVLADLHIPYHSAEAVEAAVGHTDEFDAVLLLGDVLDFHRLSRFTHEADAPSFGEELRRAGEFLDWLSHRVGGRPVYHKEGNHEERLADYLARCAKDLMGVEKFRLPSLCDYEERGIEWIGDRRAIKAGHLTLFHGHELDRGIAVPVNPAKGLWDKTGVSAVCGHWHRSSEHVVRNAHGDTSVCWTVGCLCDLRPLYAPFNRWNHGFALLDLAESGEFHFQNLKIIDGKVY